MADDLLNKLSSKGWQKQFSASGARLREAVDNYRKLGFEVITIPAKELVNDGCSVCFDDESDEMVMIFTRKTDAKIKDELYNDLN